MNEDCFHLGIKALIRNNRGEMLLLRMSPGHDHGGGQTLWDLPGGRVHKGASVEATLRREVEEETGLQDIVIGKHLGMMLANVRIPLPGQPDVGLILSIYECHIPPGAKITISEEHTTHEWCSPKEAASRLAAKFPSEFCSLLL